MIAPGRRWLGASLRGLLWLLMVCGAGLMILASASYLQAGDAHPFILEKLPLQRESLFKLALYSHVATALIALPCCLLLVLKITQKRVPRLHRWLGRFTGSLIVLVVVPSGFSLAFTAKGGLAKHLRLHAHRGRDLLRDGPVDPHRPPTTVARPPSVQLSRARSARRRGGVQVLAGARRGVRARRPRRLPRRALGAGGAGRRRRRALFPASPPTQRRCI